ncbi:AAA family ATPase [Thioclava sp. NG1]|uniref:AAA family ATPase n=1 Tax=Thioclava sp. NG1 TaxID=2182426 RepID=UPI0018EE4FE0|nr:AAA family ATPase [Thioclava sp. NG1]
MNKTFYPTSSNASHHKSARQPGRKIGDNQPQASKKTDRQTRVRALIRALGDGMHEREEIIAVALLGAMCGQNSFLYGPPGTAKSLISRRLACAFEAPAYFEYLMNRFRVRIHNQ